jgi:uncharacterized membrane protein
MMVRAQKKLAPRERSIQGQNTRPLISASLLLGIGMGGFVDGILFHQLLQLHNMLSAKYPTRDVNVQQLAVNLEINMFWDGLFHAFTWLMTAVGLAMLWRAMGRQDVPHSTRIFVGGLLLGWGLFNVVEGIIDHHLLHIHHVIEAPNHLLWDLVFLGSGVLLIAVGGWLIYSYRNQHSPPEECTQGSPSAVETTDG